MLPHVGRAVSGVALVWMLVGCGGGVAAPSDGWTPLFNGKDLAGWQQRGKGEFFVKDGLLVGTQTDGRGGDLYTTGEWDNFELRAVYRMVWPANSGFWYRYDPAKGAGYQFDVLKWPKPVAYSGTLYCPGKMFLFANLDESKENRDGWNEARVSADGDHLVHWLNGEKMGEVRDTTLTKGRIGIQVHGGNQFKGMTIVVKSIEIRPLPAGKAAAPSGKQ